MEVIQESSIREQFKSNNNTWFQNFINEYDNKMEATMKNKGYRCIHSMERTVIFTFGEFTFRRKRWKKGSKWVVPVDTMLGLEKNTRYSLEFMYQVACLSTLMSYDMVVKAIDLVYQVSITKPSVVKAVKMCGELINEKNNYRYFNEYKLKESIDILYIEGDGVMVKARENGSDNKNFDLSHFVLHTGSYEEYKNRYKLDNKKEFISMKNSSAREQLIDYIYNTYQITTKTILVTNSDGGHGYTPYIFKELAKDLNVKYHEHFWDEYHVNKLVKEYYKEMPITLLEKVFKALKKHSKSELEMVLDTTESILTSEVEEEKFSIFKRKLLNNFQYLKPAKFRGLKPQGIGIMESQHRKVTYRMKKRGMYWSKRGASTMSQMIVLSYEGKLHDLFFGPWRKEYEPYKEITNFSAADIFNYSSDERNYQLPKLALNATYRYKK
ncbi:ISLre2 family transposase [Streptococcus agalactiae]|uniref:ISLre2 family transposase n=1 Tax=Streptococcus agalactiae TaxID=1311 RepID=UPI002415016B|nr:ISLre2 family transposase [Streptococcus agalactiae]